MTAPHQSPRLSAFAERPLPQEPHQPHQQPTHPPVAPGQHLRPWPVNPEQQQQHPQADQPYRLPGHPDQQPGRRAADEELRRAQARMQGDRPHGLPESAPRPMFVRKQRFAGLAIAALALGIIGIVGGVIGALVGPAIVMLKYFTIGLAVIGVVLGVIAILGTRKVLAGVGTVLCIGAIAVALTAQVAGAPDAEAALDGADDAAKDVALQSCTVVREGADARAEVALEISNRTDQRQSYNITVTVNDQGGPRVGEVHAISTAIEPGQTTLLSGAQATGPVNGRAQAGPADCRVTEVIRLALG
jgi:hypothetical protein